MRLELEAMPESGRDRVEGFLRRVFNAPDSAVFLDPAQLHWKYWQPRSDWAGSRSYVYRTETGGIAAHACAWPFGLTTVRESLTGVHPIDWAADAKIPGAGAFLLRELRALRDISCCIGGTPMAQKVIAQSGFRPVCNMRYFVRPIRPWSNALTHPRRNWKLPARLVRNLAWTMERRAAIPAGWSCVRVEPEEIPESLWPTADSGLAVASRSAGLLRYMLCCPTARYRIWLAQDHGVPRGYFVISFVPGQARLADAWIAPNSADAWRAIFALASGAAMEDKSAVEIMIATSLSEAAAGAGAAGFRPCSEIPIMLFDPRKYLLDTPHIHLQMMDSDAAFLHDNRLEYLT